MENETRPHILYDSDSGSYANNSYAFEESYIYDTQDGTVYDDLGNAYSGGPPKSIRTLSLSTTRGTSL
jgi:hypothetical protein